MPPPPSPHPVIVIDLSAGRLEQPVLDGADLTDLITRLAPVIPASAVWTLRPANHGKVTDDPPAEGAPP